MRLRSPVVLISWPVFSRKETDQNHSEQKAADVGPPGNTTSVGSRRGQCRRTVEELHDEPETEHDQRRYLDKLDEDENWNQSQHARPGIGHDICSQHTGDGSARADTRDVAV